MSVVLETDLINLITRLSAVVPQAVGAVLDSGVLAYCSRLIARFFLLQQLLNHE